MKSELPRWLPHMARINKGLWFEQDGVKYVWDGGNYIPHTWNGAEWVSANRLLGEFLLDTALAHEVDKLVDDPALVPASIDDEKRFGMCVCCGARYSGNANECERWRAQHVCPGR